MARPAPGHSVRIKEGLWAKAVIAGERSGMTPGQYVEAAIEEKLQRDRDSITKRKEEAAPPKAVSLRAPPRH